MTLPIGPFWTDPRPGAVHDPGESFPLLPSLEMSDTDAPEKWIFPDEKPQSEGIRTLYWPDWGTVILKIEETFPGRVALWWTEYGITDTMKWRSWVLDHIHLCRDFIHEVRDFMAENKPAGTTFKQDPNDTSTWGFYP